MAANLSVTLVLLKWWTGISCCFLRCICVLTTQPYSDTFAAVRPERARYVHFPLGSLGAPMVHWVAWVPSHSTSCTLDYLQTFLCQTAFATGALAEGGREGGRDGGTEGRREGGREGDSPSLPAPRVHVSGSYLQVLSTRYQSKDPRKEPGRGEAPRAPKEVPQKEKRRSATTTTSSPDGAQEGGKPLERSQGNLGKREAEECNSHNIIPGRNPGGGKPLECSRGNPTKREAEEHNSHNIIPGRNREGGSP